MTSTPTVSQPERLIPEVDSFRAIARRHSVPTGSPECVIPLPLRLSQDRSLRANITELLRELQQSDPEFSLPDALWLLLTAIGGSDGSTHSPAIDEAVDLTASFLISIGGWRSPSTEPVTDIDHPSAHDPRLAPVEDAPVAPAAKELGHSVEQTSAAQPPQEALTSPLSGDALVLSEITRALTRLEQSTVNLRLHLDSIDQRLSRMEPLLESSPAPHPAEPSPRQPLSPTPGQPDSHATPREVIHRHDPPASPPPSPQAAAAAPATPGNGLRRDRFTAAMDLPGTRSALHMESRPEADVRNDLVAADAPAHTSSQVAARGGMEAEVRRSSSADPRSAEAGTRTVAASSSGFDQGPAAEQSPEQSITLPRGTLGDQPRRSANASPTVDSFSIAASDTTSPRPSEQRAASVAVEKPLAARGSPLSSDSAPSTSPAARLEPAPSQEAVLQHRGTLPPLRFDTAAEDPLSSDSDPDTSDDSAAELDDPKPRSNIGPHIIGIISAIVVALALLLLFLDRPFHLRPSFAPPSGTPSSPSAAPAPGPAPAENGAPQSEALPATPSPSTTASAAPSSASVPNRVLGARNGDQPRSTEQVFSTPTFVPERVMKARLVSAAPPLYPQVVNSPKLHGDVVFEAIIDKNGTVDGLTPLGGEHVLRDAAANAVRVWRFQPYTVHGQPVEVRTILHVHVEPDRTTPK